MVCLHQADALKYMAHKKIPGFIDRAVETLERKNQGDPTLIDETVEALLNPTDGQKLLQAGSSAVAKAAQAPAANAFWGMDVADRPVATNDSTAMFLQFLQEDREKDRQARAIELAERERVSAEEREKDRQARAIELAERVRVR